MLHIQQSHLSPLARVVIASSLTALATGLGALPFFPLPSFVSKCFESSSASGGKPQAPARPPLLVRYSTSIAAGMMLACALLLLSEAYDDAMGSVKGPTAAAVAAAHAAAGRTWTNTWAWAMMRVMLGLAAGVGMVVASQKYFAGGHGHGHSHGQGQGHGHGHGRGGNQASTSSSSRGASPVPPSSAAAVASSHATCPLGSALASGSTTGTPQSPPASTAASVAPARGACADEGCLSGLALTLEEPTQKLHRHGHGHGHADEDEDDWEGDDSTSLIAPSPTRTGGSLSPAILVTAPSGGAAPAGIATSAGGAGRVTGSDCERSAAAAAGTPSLPAHEHVSSKTDSDVDDGDESDEDSLIAQIHSHGPTRRAALLFLVMAAHSIAEGVSLGVSWAKSPHLGSFVSSSLALHNVPEGLAVAALVVRRGSSPLAAAGWAVASSLPQPIAAVPAFLFVSFFQWLTAAGLAFAAGAMLWVPVSDLIPEACRELPPKRVAAVATATAAGMFVLAHFLHG